MVRFLCRLQTLPSAYVLSPIPLPPFPAGRGRFFCFLMQGASPLASPGLSRKRHGNRGRTTRPAGACPGWLPADLAVPEAAGAACLLCRLSTLPLAYLLSPIPPPPSPPGKGEIFCFLMQGASPLASPGLNPNGTCTTKEFCLSTGAVPVAKERGDRGRWNYPSHATAAFEMALSPGAGIASAARVLPPSGTTAAKNH